MENPSFVESVIGNPMSSHQSHVIEESIVVNYLNQPPPGSGLDRIKEVHESVDPFENARRVEPVMQNNSGPTTHQNSIPNPYIQAGRQQYSQQIPLQQMQIQQQQPYMLVPIQQTMPTSADGKKRSVQIQCPYCRTVINTQCNVQAGKGTYIASCLLLGLLLFWIPFLFDDCKDRVHHCPNCQKEVGIRKYSVC